MSSPNPAARLQAAYPRYSVSICRNALANPRCPQGDAKVKFWCLASDTQVRALPADREPSHVARGPSPGQTVTQPAHTCGRDHGGVSAPESGDALELRGHVRLQRLADSGHIVSPAEVSADEAVEPPARGDFLRGRRPDDGVRD